MKYAKQRDANEGPIVTALDAAGASVAKLGDAGVPDLLVAYRGVIYLLEVKNPEAKGGGKYNTGEGCLTKAQVKWWAAWKGPAPTIVRTPDEALAAVGAASPSDEQQIAKVMSMTGIDRAGAERALRDGRRMAAAMIEAASKLPQR